MAIGVMFLLSGEAQRDIIHKVSLALKSNGRFLFTSPGQAYAWLDMLTGQKSHSLGREQYRAIFSAAGLALVGEYQDEGENHYYDTRLVRPCSR